MTFTSAPYRDPAQPIESRVDDLLPRMTLEEKIDQLHQCGIGDATPNNLAAFGDEFRATYGSFIISGKQADLEFRNALQRRCVEESRLGIPAVFACDVIHGYRAIFPIPLAQACAWDADLLRRACASAAEMARAQGVDWTFAPMVDHCVDPRWGRVAETFGESPHAASVFAAAAVEGFQGPRLGGRNSIAACLKHFVGYGASEGGRDYAATDITPQRLWENHLPPFHAGVRAGALTVMSAFNDLNGVPASANRWTLTDVLRERWNFGGPVVSDWNAVLQLVQQGFAADEADAVRGAIAAGVDVDMTDGLYRKHLGALVASGAVSARIVDDAVRRVLRLKFTLGLFERPFVERTGLTGSAPTPAQLDLCEEFAGRAIVLLKNEGAVLPLAPGLKRVALIGPLATEGAALLGSWAQQGRGEETETITDALKARLPAGATLAVAHGCAIEDSDDAGFAEAVAAARTADVTVLCLGEQFWMSGENASRSTLRLSGRQEDLALAIAAVGKPVVLVLVSGRPIELHALEPKIPAIMAAWQPGSRAGAALADILLGRKNPSGRLAITWPRTTGQIPVYHHERPRARAGKEGAYQDIDTAQLYAFGHGLSYTTFSYSAIRLSAPTVKAGETLAAEVTVTNVGESDGRECVLWFIWDPAASITRPKRELKHFESASIPAGQGRVFRWRIVPEHDLAFPDEDGCLRLELGEIHLFAGPSEIRFEVRA